MAAYGRIDVYWPEGPIESFPLEKPVVAVGRSSGNDIMLDTTAISRYHLTLTLKGDQVILEDLDSVNGTYVDGVRMRAHEPHPLRDGEEIQIGDVRLIFHPAGSDSSGPSDQRVESAQASFKVEVEDAEQTVTPGAHIQTLVSILNTGPETEHFIIQVDGISKDWVRLDRTEAEIQPGSKAQIVLSIKPVRRSDSRPDIYNLTVRVIPKTHEQQTVEVPMKLHVLAYSGFGIVMGTPRLMAGSAFELYTQNQGNAPLPVAFIGSDPGKRFDFEFQPQTVTLAPGEKRTVRGHILPKRRGLMRSSGEFRFDIVAQSRDASAFQAPVSGVFVEKGGIPSWLLVGGLAVAGLIVLVLVAGAVVIPLVAGRATATPTASPSPAPTITPVMVNMPTFTPPETATPPPTIAPPPTTPPPPTETALPTATLQAADITQPAPTVASSPAPSATLEAF